MTYELGASPPDGADHESVTVEPLTFDVRLDGEPGATAAADTRSGRSDGVTHPPSVGADPKIPRDSGAAVARHVHGIADEVPPVVDPMAENALAGARSIVDGLVGAGRVLQLVASRIAATPNR